MVENEVLIFWDSNFLLSVLWGGGVMCVYHFPLRNNLGLTLTVKLIAIRRRETPSCLFLVSCVYCATSSITS